MTTVVIVAPRTMSGSRDCCPVRDGASSHSTRRRAIVPQSFHTPACRTTPRSSANTVAVVCDANIYRGLELPAADASNMPLDSRLGNVGEHQGGGSDDTGDFEGKV